MEDNNVNVSDSGRQGVTRSSMALILVVGGPLVILACFVAWSLIGGFVYGPGKITLGQNRSEVERILGGARVVMKDVGELQQRLRAGSYLVWRFEFELNGGARGLVGANLSEDWEYLDMSALPQIGQCVLWYDWPLTKALIIYIRNDKVEGAYWAGT